MGRPSGRRILVFDDNKDAAVSLAMMLELMGNHVKTAHDGIEALDVAAAFRPDLVLPDIGMPRLNGYETAKRMRQQTWGTDLKLVAITGWGQVNNSRRSDEAGFDLHMVKPIETAALEKLLASLVGCSGSNLDAGHSNSKALKCGIVIRFRKRFYTH